MAYPDPVALVRTYLAGLHPGATIASRVPSPKSSGEWIQLRLVGGAQLRPVRDVSRLDVFYWAASEPAAATGADTVRREIHALAKTSTLGVVCYRVEETMRPRPFDDPLDGAISYWATYSLTLRADDAII